MCKLILTLKAVFFVDYGSRQMFVVVAQLRSWRQGMGAREVKSCLNAKTLQTVELRDDVVEASGPGRPPRLYLIRFMSSFSLVNYSSPSNTHTLRREPRVFTYTAILWCFSFYNRTSSSTAIPSTFPVFTANDYHPFQPFSCPYYSRYYVGCCRVSPGQGPGSRVRPPYLKSTWPDT